MNYILKRKLSKILYYRYFDLLQSSTFLGDTKMIHYSKRMMKVVLPYVKSGILFDLSKNELKSHKFPCDLIADLDELATTGNLQYVLDYKSKIPTWLHDFISPQYLILHEFHRFLISKSITSKDELVSYLKRKNQFTELEEKLYHMLTYMDSANFSLGLINKYESNDDTNNVVNGNPLYGTLHNHTVFSDGIISISDVVDLAKLNKYNYIGISDHSGATLLGMDAQGITVQHDEIDRQNSDQQSVKLLKGIECEILSNGQLDLSDNDLERFDYVIIGIHSHYEMNKKEVNRRLIRAIENRYTDILAHPTCRLYGSKPGFIIDNHYIIDACVRNNVIIEINGNWKRLDLDPKYIQYAIDKGAVFELAADVHYKSDFIRINNAISIAETMAIPHERIINLMPYDNLVSYFDKLHHAKRVL